MEKNRISAKIIADSKNEFGHRITSMVLTMPRFILAEFNTHRVFSRNSASSRAVPFERMVKRVNEDPFFPTAWQKDHPGMQGTEYFDEVEANTLRRGWLTARDNAVDASTLLHSVHTTKQLCNRLLEPFMWHTVIVTATEWENFFELRCPQYEFDNRIFRSIKDVCNYIGNCVFVKMDGATAILTSNNTTYQTTNKGQAEIHMMELAEAMWDAYQESEPKQLKAGEWHIPFGDNIDKPLFKTEDTRHLEGGSLLQWIPAPEVDGDWVHGWQQKQKVKIATARCARVSYINYEGKDDYESDFKLYERLKESGHMSPFEHCAIAMSSDDLDNWGVMENKKYTPGICRNFIGFLQLRAIM